MFKPTLLILAAGLSSRYGLGLKQLDTFGPSGETLLDYAIYDAIQAGFGKAVFVIRKKIKDDFEKFVTYKYQNIIDYEFAFQELDDLPEGIKPVAIREKPWGTGHAVWTARNKIKEPFAVINADDFYGRESYKTMASFLTKQTSLYDGKYAMVGFDLRNTLSRHGFVSRGVCEVKEGYLIDIDERSNIHEQDGLPVYLDENNVLRKIDPKAIASMNLWGFSPDLFFRFENAFKAFLTQNLGNNTAEFYLPQWIKAQIKTQQTTVKVLKTSNQWMGVTNPDDKPVVSEMLKSYTDSGIYPTPLF